MAMHSHVYNTVASFNICLYKINQLDKKKTTKAFKINGYQLSNFSVNWIKNKENNI
jgi:hypothetical protein